MSRSKKPRPAIAVGVTLAVLAVFGPAPAMATVLVELSLEDMTRGSDLVVHGVVVRSDVQMVMRNGALEPRTVTTLRVLEWVKGSGGAEVTVREIGGTWLGGGLRIDGVPTYAAGDEVIVFLERFGELGQEHLRTYGMVQGRFAVRHGVPGVLSTVRRDTSGVAFARWSGGLMRVEAGGPEPVVGLHQFLMHVRQVVSTYGEAQ